VNSLHLSVKFNNIGFALLMFFFIYDIMLMVVVIMNDNVEYDQWWESGFSIWSLDLLFCWSNKFLKYLAEKDTILAGFYLMTALE